MIVFYIISVIIVLILRVLFLIVNVMMGNFEIKTELNFRTLISIGSGGHTSEMLRIIGTLNATKYQPLLYILAENDVSSEVKIHKLHTLTEHVNYEIRRIPRSRNVNQSYFSSISSTLNAALRCFPIIYRFKPNIIISNGPGTCIPICLVGFVLRCLFIVDCRIVFIESVCRVNTLSLSGKIMQFFSDVFIIQWPQLRNACIRWKTQYFGRLT